MPSGRISRASSARPASRQAMETASVLTTTDSIRSRAMGYRIEAEAAPYESLL